ncbi:hypothetical protein ACP4OV_018445 [Aristida adscensionis]
MKATKSLLAPVVIILALFLLSSTIVISDYVGKCPGVRKDKERACSDAIGVAEGCFYDLCLNTLLSRFNGSTYEVA